MEHVRSEAKISIWNSATHKQWAVSLHCNYCTDPSYNAYINRNNWTIIFCNERYQYTMTTKLPSSLAILHIIRELRSTGKRLSQFSHARGQENSILYKDSRLKTSIVFYYFVDLCGITYNNWVERLSDNIYLDYFNRRYEINTIWTYNFEYFSQKSVIVILFAENMWWHQQPLKSTSINVQMACYFSLSTPQVIIMCLPTPVISYSFLNSFAENISVKQ